MVRRYASPVWTYAQHLIGKGRIKPVNGAQVALRGPNPALVPQGQEQGGGAGAGLSPTQWHIDGMGKGKHSPFSLLVGITLSDVTGPNQGNFCVFPGKFQPPPLPACTSAWPGGEHH